MNETMELVEIEETNTPKEEVGELEEDVIIENNVSRIEIENELIPVKELPTKEKDEKEKSELIEIVKIDDESELDCDDKNREEEENESMELKSISERESIDVSPNLLPEILECEETEEIIEIKQVDERDMLPLEQGKRKNMEKAPKPEEINFDSEETVSRYCLENCLEWYELFSRCGKFKHVRGKITYLCCENGVTNPHNTIFPISEKVSKDEVANIVKEYKSPVVWLETCEYVDPKKFGFIELPSNFNFTSIVVDLKQIQEVIEEETKKLGPISTEEYEFVDIDTCHSKVFEDGIKLFFKVHYSEFGPAFNKKSHELFLETYTFDDSIFGKREGCNVRALAMTHKGEVVSFLELFRDKNGLCGINNVSTAQGHRRKRLCTKLLHEAVKICRNEWNCRYICGLGSPDGLSVYTKYKVKFGVQYKTFIRFNIGACKNHVFHYIFGCLSSCGCLSLM